MLILISVRTPQNILGQYLNFRIYFEPSNQGLKISKAKIGKISVPGWMVYRFIEGALNTIVGQRQGSELLSTIRGVQFKNEVVVIYLAAIPDIRMRLNMFKNRLKKIRDNVNPVCDPVLVPPGERFSVFYRPKR